MAVKEKKKVPEQPSEQQRVADWRREQFKYLVPEVTDLQIELLVNKIDTSPRDLEKLLKRGCDPRTALKILL
jgi:hypothetical protein